VGFEDRVRERHAVPNYLDVRHSVEFGNEFALGPVPADDFEPIRHRLRRLDEQHFGGLSVALRLVASGAEVGEAGRLEALALERHQPGFHQ
jgi:hypothetical protein